MPIRPAAMPIGSETVLSLSDHTKVSHVSAGKTANESLQSLARAHKTSLDDELDTAKIGAIDESVNFLSNYTRDADNPDIIIKYTNMMRDQWTRQLVLVQGMKHRAIRQQGGSPAGSLASAKSQKSIKPATNEPPAKDATRGTPNSFRGAPIHWPNEDDFDNDPDDDDDPFENQDCDDPDDFSGNRGQGKRDLRNGRLHTGQYQH
jgi:hypothetical protein